MSTCMLILLGQQNEDSEKETFLLIQPGDNTTIVSPPHSHPWTVGLVDRNSRVWSRNRSFCGGALIGPRHVITAAHCVDIFNSAEDIDVLVGEHDQRVNDGQEKIHLKQKVIIHPKFDAYRSTDYDLAILVLEKRVHNKYAKVALLPQPHEVFTKVNVTGWGSMGINPKPNHTSDVLRTVELDVIMPGDKYSEKCGKPPFNSRNRTWQDFDFETLICGVNVKDLNRKPCDGDSGGNIALKY